ncbi:transcription elongation factor GreA [Motilibacter rhizosphaerae]|uniref:Transcription elongation factor GreA n=1 Tax=Motilibacter rhizosphaerae TaxID=598652 RepID=A0A4Q7NQM3_9ACTN|nr:transcription elongation factor GreA [Motilibacter rhizosphaerae]RZS87316.1 transcription elongation factor GreA [Motilibacter rhizosphaerae]
MSETTSTTWLTQEQYDRLTAELEQLRGPARAEIVKRIEAAREEGDLKENGGYHAAKEEQGKQEARIRQLQQLLERAQIGAPKAADGTVAPGMVVTADVAGFEERFLLGSRQGISGDIDVYSPDSPLGAAILGQRVGSTTSYTAPNGKEITVVVKAAAPYAR